jgi:hypothetical protein
MELNITHYPIMDTAAVCEHYSEKDGVPIKYVCTTDLRASDMPWDIYYRDTPHPEFGNRYFGLRHTNGTAWITDADIVETFEFGMIEVEGILYYSQSHHDYKVVGKKMIDGGRQYIRCGGRCDVYTVKNGVFKLQIDGLPL